MVLYVDGAEYKRITYECTNKTVENLLHEEVYYDFYEMKIFNISILVYLYYNFFQYFLSFGVGVGGTLDFPENIDKPWKNIGNKARLDIFEKSNTFSNKWKKNEKKLVIESVKIWAL